MLCLLPTALNVSLIQADQCRQKESIDLEVWTCKIQNIIHGCEHKCIYPASGTHVVSDDNPV